MAAIQYNPSVPVSSAADASVTLTGRILRGFKAMKSYNALRRAERDLMALDDRLLADIGIERSNIHQRVWNGRTGR